MNTTIRHLAAAAGVSVATASRAMSGSPAVVEATRQRVLQAAAQLDYTPSRLARSLVTGLTGNVGVIVPDITNSFYPPFLAELESTLAARDLGLVIGNSHESRERELGLARRMSTQVDTVVLASSRLSDEQIVQAVASWPVVLVNRRLDPAFARPERLTEVVIDVEPGFAAAVGHLHALGHRQLTYVDGPPQSWSATQKRVVLNRVCADLGIALTIVGTARPDFSTGRTVGTEIVATGATAVLTYNDQVALGVLAACHDAGAEVPEQISVVGCDDSLPDGLARPGLTTIDSSARSLGAMSAAAVVDPSAARHGTVPTRLVVRGSTGPPPPEPTESIPRRGARMTARTATRTPSSALLRDNPVIAVLRASRPEDYDAVVEVLTEHGVRSIELTLSTPGTLDHLPSLLRRVGSDVEIGIGTITDVEQAQRAIDEGARYLVTPLMDLGVIALAVRHGIPVYPGGLTPTELFSGWRAGASAVKIFPAQTVGAQYVRHLRGPFPDLQFVPSGGIGLEDIPAWLRAGATAVSLGGPLVGEALNGGSLKALADRVRTAMDVVASTRAAR